MKNLHRKIAAILLSGVAVGSFSSSAIKVYADNNFIIDHSSGKPVPIVPIDEEFNPNLYINEYPVLEVDSEYAYKIRDPRDILPKGNDVGVNSIYKLLQGSGFELIKVSGIRDNIDKFVKNVNIPILKQPQVCFKDLKSFRQYISSLQYKVKPKEGVYRFMLWGYEGLFYFNPSKLLNMFDEPMINLYAIQRKSNEYGYEVLDFNFDGIPSIKKYKKPILFNSLNEFFDKISDFDRRKVPGHFGSKNHGGVQPGGIYCIQIDKLIVLFRALK